MESWKAAPQYGLIPTLHHPANPPPPPPAVVEVVAGLIFRDGRLLITQRPSDAHLGGCWEFPGGKREADETPPSALQRELREELGVEVRVGEWIETVTHSYPGKTVRIEFYRCALTSGEPRAIECAGVRWVKAVELDAFTFPAADARLLQRLKSESEWWHQGG